MSIASLPLHLPQPDNRALLPLCKWENLKFVRLVATSARYRTGIGLQRGLCHQTSPYFVSTYKWQVVDTCGVSSPQRAGPFTIAFLIHPSSSYISLVILQITNIFLAGLDELVGPSHC